MGGLNSHLRLHDRGPVAWRPAYEFIAADGGRVASAVSRLQTLLGSAVAAAAQAQQITASP